MPIGARKERGVRENGESDETGESVMEQEKREQDAYSILSDHVNTELTEKKSVFLTDAYPVHSEEEAAEKIQEVSRKYYDARHHCFAYVLGDHKEIVRQSDNKEPAGTAGRPILSVIQGENLTYVLIVVTRYFGGILLGTGGLVRAYTGSAKAVLHLANEEGKILTLRHAQKLRIHLPYAQAESLQYDLAQKKIRVLETVYEAEVTIHICVPAEEAKGVILEITQKTSGAAQVVREEEGFFCRLNFAPLPYSNREWIHGFLIFPFLSRLKFFACFSGRLPL